MRKIYRRFVTKAYYARPASSADDSEYAVVRQELFEYQEHHLDAG